MHMNATCRSPSAFSLSQARKSRAVTTLACACLALILFLGGCASTPEQSDENPGQAPGEQPPPSPGSNEGADGDAGTATASINGQEFTFTLTHCTMYQHSEVELGGPGSENGSDTPSYLDGGLMQMDTDALGEFRINLGTNQPFDSSEELLSLGAPSGEGLTVTKGGDGYQVTANAWDDQGTDLGTGTLRFTCR